MAQNNQVSIKPRTNAEWAAERRMEDIYSHGNREGYSRNSIDASVRIRESNILQESFGHTPHFSSGRLNESNFSQVRNYTAQQYGPASMNNSSAIAREASQMGPSKYKNEDEYGMLATLGGEDDEEFAEFDKTKHGEHALGEYTGQARQKQPMTGKYGNMDKELIPMGTQASRGNKVKTESWRDPYVHQLLTEGGMMDAARAVGKRVANSDAVIGARIHGIDAHEAVKKAGNKLLNSDAVKGMKSSGEHMLDKAKNSKAAKSAGEFKDSLIKKKTFDIGGGDTPSWKSKTVLSNKGRALVGTAGVGTAGVGAAGVHHFSKKQESDHASDYVAELKKMSPEGRQSSAEEAVTSGRRLSAEEASHHARSIRDASEYAAQHALGKRDSAEELARLRYHDTVHANGEHLSPGGKAAEEVAERFKGAKVAGKGMAALLALGFGAHEIKKAYDSYKDRHGEEPSHEELHNELKKSK